MRDYEWRISGEFGSVQADDMRSAIRLALEGYLRHAQSNITESTATLKVQVIDRNYQPSVVQPSSQLEFIAFNHQNKGNPFIQALWKRGYRRSGNHTISRKVDFILTDHATNSKADTLRDFYIAGTDKFFVYPHTARPNLVNDIACEFEGVTAQFVAAPGHVDVMRSYGYEKPIHVVGWSLCPIVKFQPRDSFRRVLFAPIHGRCIDVDKAANREAFNRLYRLANMGKIKLTVRYYRSLEDSGLERVPGSKIIYNCIENLEPDWSQIDAADVVVSHQTFAYLAVARGIPTIMFGEDIPPHLVPMSGREPFAKNWDKYRWMMRYPYDITDCDQSGVTNMMRNVISSDNDIAEWRKRMIGEQFNEDVFVGAIESYL